MKSTKRLSMMLILLLVFTLVLSSCTQKPAEETVVEPETNEATTEEKEEPMEDKEEYSQGVTDTTIKVGNTTAVSGALAFVGVPFNEAIKAYFKQINDAGGIGGKTIEFVSYDDGFDGATGAALTEKLVEEDEIFALVGHFGTPTVSATLDYIAEYGIPMVYAATGINALYFEEDTPMNPIMAVQPIYFTDGRIMAARAFHEDLFDGAKLAADAKVGVLYTNDDAGSSILAGVEAQAEADGFSANLVVEAVADGTYSTAVQKLKDAGVSLVIMAMNQPPFVQSMVAMDDAGLEVPVFASYVNAAPAAIDHTKHSENRPIYTNAWVDLLSEEGQAAAAEYVACISQADLDDETKTAYFTDPYATAGYIAAAVFVEGLMRVEENGEVLNWDNYIKAMEQAPIDIPMGSVVDFTNGHRWGIDSMSLLQYTVEGEGDDAVEAFVKVREIESLTDIANK